MINHIQTSKINYMSIAISQEIHITGAASYFKQTKFHEIPKQYGIYKSWN